MLFGLPLRIFRSCSCCAAQHAAQQHHKICAKSTLCNANKQCWLAAAKIVSSYSSLPGEWRLCWRSKIIIKLWVQNWKRPTRSFVLRAAAAKAMISNWGHVLHANLYDIAVLHASGIIDQSTKKHVRSERLNYETKFYQAAGKHTSWWLSNLLSASTAWSKSSGTSCITTYVMLQQAFMWWVPLCHGGTWEKRRAAWA